MDRTGVLLVAVGLLGGCPSEGDFVFVGPPGEVDSRPVTLAAEPPPAISGGTLVVSRDDRTAIAADPDRDVLWRLDLRSGQVLSVTTFEPGDEPGRVVEDQLGRIHVALRGGGAVATIDPQRAQEVRRLEVCPAPRGLAYDDDLDRLHVACAGGELVTVSATTGREFRRLQLRDDLRDVVILEPQPFPGYDLPGGLLVTRFRKAEVLHVLGTGEVVDTSTPPTLDTIDPNGAPTEFIPAVAWRTRPLPDGGALMVHQRDETLVPFINEYYGDDQIGTGIIQTTVSVFEPGQSSPVNQAVRGAVLPVDIAVGPDGEQLAIAGAGDEKVIRLERADLGQTEWGMVTTEIALPGVIAVAFDSQGRLVGQSREPARIGYIGEVDGQNEMFDLPTRSVQDTGHQMFHQDSGTGIACGSCHPEGRDDGQVWTFQDVGARRTQNIGGGILATAPFHWDGDLPTMSAFMSEVFVGRMGGVQPSPERIGALSRWVDALPTPTVTIPTDSLATTRGAELFRSREVGCIDCHSGLHFTNNRSADVGTGGRFQVPGLVGLATRGPFLHDGCAETLRDRFGACGGGDRHGHTSQLSREQLDDLVAYLSSL